MFYNNYQIKNIIEKTITKEIKAKINSIDITKQTVQAAIEEGIIAHVRDGINSAMTKCVESEVVSQISEINIPKESVKRKIEESINEFLNDKVLMEKVVASVLRNSEFMNVVSTSIVKNTCDMNLIKSTFEEVIKEQFLEVYDRDICDRSFAVQIIDTISKNEKLNAVQINFIKSILDKVFYTNN